MNLDPSLIHLAALATLGFLFASCASNAASEDPGPSLGVHYLEYVSEDVDATCKALESAHGVTFGEPVAEFGNARTARLSSGGELGVRAPMHAAETPVVRTYLLVDDIDAAVNAAVEAGGQLAMAPTEMPGRGRFAIYMLGGNQFGLWQK